ncbi:MAG: preprotein translocase subunit SecY [Kiritimatiellia bacterium]
MLKTFANLFKIPELRTRVLFTIGLVAIARLLAMIPTPGVDWSALMQLQANIAATASGGLIGWFDTFTGGGLTNFSVGTLSIWPYISAQIIIQLMTAVIPTLGKLQREGDSGRKTLNLYIRWLTIAICIFQAVALANTMLNPARLGGGDVDVVVMNPVLFYMMTVISMTGASMFVMWLGDQITERGIGNGVSLLIMINITSRLPVAVADAARRYFGAGDATAQAPVWELLVLLIFGFAVLLGTVALTQALRKIPIHSTRAISQGSSYGGGQTYLPLRVNYAGVMPIIFAGPILALLGMLKNLKGSGAFTATLQRIGEAVVPSGPSVSYVYIALYGGLILFFTFFWVATQFNAMNISEGLKRDGSYIPGIRPGLATAEYLDAVMTRVTLIGALSLLSIAVIPLLLTARDVPTDIANFFGGTSLLIIVGVALDTLRQMESQLVMRNYDGFLKHGRIAGRR